MLTREGRDLPLLEITPENYLVQDCDKSVFAVKIEQTQFDQKTGKRLSIPRIQMFGVKEWNLVKSNLKKQDYTYTVLYDPTEFLAEKAKEEKAVKFGKGKNPVNNSEIEALKAEIERLKAELEDGKGKNPVGRPPKTTDV